MGLERQADLEDAVTQQNQANSADQRENEGTQVRHSGESVTSGGTAARAATGSQSGDHREERGQRYAGEYGVEPLHPPLETQGPQGLDGFRAFGVHVESVLLFIVVFLVLRNKQGFAGGPVCGFVLMVNIRRPASVDGVADGGMLHQVVFEIHDGFRAADKEDRVAVVQHTDLVGCHEFPSGLLEIGGPGAGASFGLTMCRGVYGGLAQRFGNILMGTRFVASEIQNGVRIARNCLPRLYAPPPPCQRHKRGRRFVVIGNSLK